ncbi:lipid IV(A) 4-amino-4-deoxy-L-arabinosyltransferase [Marinobacter halodurans]|uniref:Undecaprenyl phosphate-alpha-4-amino-4-deoxy-L-arabinose arabinosyl transferase n=1 Tax=Marinobacter halodurans TaxID=2528979 RepID=A0ABY1ZHY8_9GAMM|nr:lipid IV(A) 4-amino-4-deoxy-L-arabinosyltransferase [Marinobacter halodurans]TBW47899.1 lipid IV(A) 4-amino-4-deoxy-L-arabinosyltransferase [Marinobacter halodurans]
MNLRSWLLIPLYGLIYLIPLNFRPLWIPDETRYAEISREMLQNGDWIVPKLLGLRYFEKPVAGYWLNNISQWLFGDSNFAVRFASAACTALSACLVYWFAQRLWQDRQKAVASALIYLACLLVMVIGTDAILDAMLTLWLNLAMVSFYLTVTAVTRKQRLWGYVILGLACGMGFLTKGFLALAIPVIAVVPFMLKQRRFLELVKYGIIPILVAAAISLPWSLRIASLEGDYWHYFFWIEHIQRFSSPNAQHNQPFWFYLPILLLGLMPWVGWVPAALKRLRQEKADRRAQLYLAAWAVLPFLFFSTANGKLPAYILPCFAPLAILLGAGVVQLVRDNRQTPFKANAWINIAFGLLGVIALIIVTLKPGHRPAFGPDDHFELAVAFIIFAAWAAFGWLQLSHPIKRWSLAALCPVPLALFFSMALPSSVTYSKLPQIFIHEHQALLDQTDQLLSNNVGLAGALAWELKTSDVMMFDDQGELDYGLSYPDAQSRYVSLAAFPAWLREARRSGSVAILLRGKKPDYFDALPTPDQHLSKGKFDLIIYTQRSGSS